MTWAGRRVRLGDESAHLSFVTHVTGLAAMKRLVLSSFLVLSIVFLSGRLEATEWLDDLPGDIAGVVWVKSLDRLSTVMRKTGILASMADRLDRMFAPLSEGGVLDPGGGAGLVLLGRSGESAPPVAVILPVGDIRAFLAGDEASTVRRLRSGVYALGRGRPARRSLYFDELSSSRIVLAYSESQCLRVHDFLARGGRSIHEVLEESEREMLLRADVATIIFPERLFAVLEPVLRRLGRPASREDMRANAPAGSDGLAPVRAALGSVERITMGLTASEERSTGPRNFVELDMLATPKTGSKLEALCLSQEGRSAPLIASVWSADAGAAATWDMSCPPALVETILRRLAGEEQRGAILPASQPASAPASQAASREAESDVDRLVEATTALIDEVAGPGGISIVRGEAGGLGLFAWQARKEGSGRETDEILETWCGRVNAHLKRLGLDPAVDFKPAAVDFGGISAGRMTISSERRAGPLWQALLFPYGGLHITSANVGAERAVRLADRVQRTLSQYGQPSEGAPAQLHMGCSLYALSLMAVGNMLTEKDLTLFAQMADAHEIRGPGIVAAVSCAQGRAQLQVRLRLEDLFLALAVFSKAREETAVGQGPR